jgi:hypothetical protein
VIVVTKATTTGEIGWGSAAIGGGGISWTAPILGTQAAVLLILSPYLIEYYNYPQCRKEQSLADMARCVQEK